MNCPVCSKLMVEEDFGGVKIDVCKNGCKGMWFDWFELEKLDEENEDLGNALDEALAHPPVSVANRGKINCPKCGVPMYAHRYKKAAHTVVDECTNCGGFFLDAGELRAIRETFMSEAEQQEHLKSLLADVPNYRTRKKELEYGEVRRKAADKYRVLMIGRLFRMFP